MVNHKELIAWQKAVALAQEVHELTSAFPRHELFGLSAQMRRSSVSIPSNIAEGAARGSTRDFLRFLHMARGSYAELETQLLLALQSRYIVEGALIFNRLEDVGKLLNALIMSLRRRLRG